MISVFGVFIDLHLSFFIIHLSIMRQTIRSSLSQLKGHCFHDFMWNLFINWTKERMNSILSSIFSNSSRTDMRSWRVGWAVSRSFCSRENFMIIWLQRNLLFVFFAFTAAALTRANKARSADSEEACCRALNCCAHPGVWHYTVGPISSEQGWVINWAKSDRFPKAPVSGRSESFVSLRMCSWRSRVRF